MYTSNAKCFIYWPLISSGAFMVALKRSANSSVVNVGNDSQGFIPKTYKMYYYEFE